MDAADQNLLTALLHDANFLLGSDGVGIDNCERELDRVKVMIRLAEGIAKRQRDR